MQRRARKLRRALGEETAQAFDLGFGVGACSSVLAPRDSHRVGYHQCAIAQLLRQARQNLFEQGAPRDVQKLGGVGPVVHAETCKKLRGKGHIGIYPVNATISCSSSATMRPVSASSSE